MMPQRLMTARRVGGQNPSFAAAIYTGAAPSSVPITGPVAPNWVYLSRLIGGSEHLVYDYLRGGSQNFGANTTRSQETDSGNTVTFTSTGITVADTNANMNLSSITYLSWMLRESVSYGFAIVPGIGTGSGSVQTIPQGLTRVPTMIMGRNLTSGGPTYVYHVTNGATRTLQFNSSNPRSTSSVWGDTTPTTTNFFVSSSLNNIGEAYIFYLFADIPGICKAFSYTGNADTTGPVVNLGFRPRALTPKCSTASGGWVLGDYVQNPTSNWNKYQIQNESSGQYTQSFLTTSSTGFQIVSADSLFNASGQTFVGWATS